MVKLLLRHEADVYSATQVLYLLTLALINTAGDFSYKYHGI